MKGIPLTVVGVETRDVEIHTTTAIMLTAIRNKFGFIHNENCYTLAEREGGLFWIWDGSTHGSYKEERQLMSEDKTIIAVFRALNALEEALDEYEKAG